MDLKISVVTISYNQGEFLEETINSVISQSYPNIEYIIIDGGSSDQSVEIITKYDKYIAYWVSEPDQGPADALNKGFAKATGDIFYYLNADDVLLPGAFQKAANHFKENPKADVIYGHAFVTDCSLKITGLGISKNFGQNLNISSIIIQQATFIKRGAYEKTEGFNVNNKTCWDNELVANLHEAGVIFRHINDYFAFFRIHRQSITGSRRLSTHYLEDKRRIYEQKRVVPIRSKMVMLKHTLFFRFKRSISHCVFN